MIHFKNMRKNYIYNTLYILGILFTPQLLASEDKLNGQPIIITKAIQASPVWTKQLEDLDGIKRTEKNRKILADKYDQHFVPVLNDAVENFEASLRAKSNYSDYLVFYLKNLDELISIKNSLKTDKAKDPTILWSREQLMRTIGQINKFAVGGKQLEECNPLLHSRLGMFRALVINFLKLKDPTQYPEMTKIEIAKLCQVWVNSETINAPKPKPGQDEQRLSDVIPAYYNIVRRIITVGLKATLKDINTQAEQSYYDGKDERRARNVENLISFNKALIQIFKELEKVKNDYTKAALQVLQNRNNNLGVKYANLLFVNNASLISGNILTPDLQLSNAIIDRYKAVKSKPGAASNLIADVHAEQLMSHADDLTNSARIWVQLVQNRKVLLRIWNRNIFSETFQYTDPIMLMDDKLLYSAAVKNVMASIEAIELLIDHGPAAHIDKLKYKLKARSDFAAAILLWPGK